VIEVIEAFSSGESRAGNREAQEVEDRVKRRVRKGL